MYFWSINITINLVILVIYSSFLSSFTVCQQFNVINDEFSPAVTARCDRGVMHVTVVTSQPFYGAIHSRGYQKPPCFAVGDGGFNTTLKVGLLVAENDEDYCGATMHNDEHSITVAVRAHNSLQLTDDKYYFLTCAKSGYNNVRGGTYRVTIKLLDTNGQQLSRVIYSKPYVLRAELTPHDILGITVLRIKNCFAFANEGTEHVQLIDNNGCPTQSQIISPFSYNTSSVAEAVIQQMFKFANDNSKVHIQCDAVLCGEECAEPVCGDDSSLKTQTYATLDRYSQLSASTTLFVMERDDEALLKSIEECTVWQFPWLINLAILLAVLLLLMWCFNLFMCSTLSCNCTRTEIIEKEEPPPEIEIEDYDPDKDSTLGYKQSKLGYNNEQYVPEHESRPQSGYAMTDQYTPKRSQRSTKPLEIDYSSHFDQNNNPSRN